jgi:hypothetical protein
MNTKNTNFIETITQRADYWVVTGGLDCDGYNSGHIYPFASQEEAYKFADEQNLASDGLIYHTIHTILELREYAEYYGKTWQRYLFV